MGSEMCIRDSSLSLSLSLSAWEFENIEFKSSERFVENSDPAIHFFFILFNICRFVPSYEHDECDLRIGFMNKTPSLYVHKKIDVIRITRTCMYHKPDGDRKPNHGCFCRDQRDKKRESLWKD